MTDKTKPKSTYAQVAALGHSRQRLEADLQAFLLEASEALPEQNAYRLYTWSGSSGFNPFQVWIVSTSVEKARAQLLELMRKQFAQLERKKQLIDRWFDLHRGSTQDE